MRAFLMTVLLFSVMACGLTACQESTDPRISELERQLDEAKDESNMWRVIGWMGGIGVMLFVGAGLGASARRKSEDQDA